MPSAIPNFRKHLPLLDGVRGAAILLVMIFHMSLISGTAGIDGVARSISSAGWCGVDLFFVLSGFLITGILYDTRQDSKYFKTFYVRRALRIFPLYYAVVFFSLIVLPAAAAHLPEIARAKLDRFGRIEGDQWMYWTYLSNFAIAKAGKFRHGILDISWSLAIEEQFYLVWPTVVFFFSRATLTRICIGAILFSLAFRCWLVYAGVNAVALHVLTPSRLDALAVGAFIALVVRQEGGLDRLTAAARFVIPVFGLLLVGDGVFRYWSHSGREGEQGLFSANLPEIQTVGLTILAICFGAILVRAVAASQREIAQPGAPRSSLVRLFESPMLRSLGKYSYAMYLFHFPLNRLVRDTMLTNKQLPIIAGTELPAQIIFTIACIAITYVAAVLSWNLYEKHWLGLKRYFDYK